MYGYTMHLPVPPEAYLAMHRAMVDVIDEEGGGEGLILHLAYQTDHGCDLTEVWESKERLDAFNETVFPKAMARAGMAFDGPRPEAVEFDPLAVTTPRGFSSDAEG